MADYALDRDFLPFLSEIPTVQDYSTAEKIQAMREMRAEAFAPAPPRDDVSMFLKGLLPHLVQLCPAEERAALQNNIGHLEKST